MMSQNSRRVVLQTRLKVQRRFDVSTYVVRHLTILGAFFSHVRSIHVIVSVQSRFVPLIIHPGEYEHVQYEQRASYRNGNAECRGVGCKSVFRGGRSGAEIVLVPSAVVRRYVLRWGLGHPHSRSEWILLVRIAQVEEGQCGDFRSVYGRH